jgi:hypothetical protein
MRGRGTQEQRLSVRRIMEASRVRGAVDGRVTSDQPQPGGDFTPSAWMSPVTTGFMGGQLVEMDELVGHLTVLNDARWISSRGRGARHFVTRHGQPLGSGKPSPPCCEE